MTSEFGSDPTLRSYAQLVRRRKWWVIGLTLLGLAASLAIWVDLPAPSPPSKVTNRPRSDIAQLLEP